jgi:hypothetical protein
MLTEVEWAQVRGRVRRSSVRQPHSDGMRVAGSLQGVCQPLTLLWDGTPTGQRHRADRDGIHRLLGTVLGSGTEERRWRELELALVEGEDK